MNDSGAVSEVRGADASTVAPVPTPPPPPVDMSGIGLVTFAGAVLILAGFFEVIEGLVAMWRPAVYASGGDTALVALGYTGWGWLHLILGVLALAAGIGVLALQPWARTAGVVLAAVSAIVNLAFIPAYPIWALVLITVDLVIIYGLMTYAPADSTPAR